MDIKSISQVDIKYFYNRVVFLLPEKFKKKNIEKERWDVVTEQQINSYFWYP